MLLIVTKGMNPRKIILITCLILVANQLKAQILKTEMLSAGNNVLNFSSQSIESPDT